MFAPTGSVRLITNHEEGEQIMENEKENPKDIVNLVLKAVALAMGVVVVTLSILGVITAGVPVSLLGLGLACLAITALDRE